MKTEILEKNRHAECRALWEEIFDEDSAAFLDAYYAGKGAQNEISVIRESDCLCEGAQNERSVTREKPDDGKGEIGAMIHWNLRTLLFHGHAVRADFIVAVATKEKLRRRGLMARLMTEGLQKRAKEDMPFVFLTPVNEAYYTPFQFVTVGMCMGLKLPCISKENTSIQVCELPPEAYAFAAEWCNERLAGRYAYFVKREEAYFWQLAAELASENGKIMAAADGERLVCVFLYTAEEYLEVREPVCDEADEDAALAAICSWASGMLSWDTCGAGAPADTGENAWDFRNQNSYRVQITACGKRPDAQPQSVTMVRITSLAACIGMLRCTETLQQNIRVRDPLIPENNGCFRLSLSPKGCSLTRSDAPGADCLPYTVEELTALIFQNGYLNELV